MNFTNPNDAFLTNLLRAGQRNIDLQNHAFLARTASLPLQTDLNQLAVNNFFASLNSILNNAVNGRNKLERSFSESQSSRYKTELCRPFEEEGECKYCDKCQFAHGVEELRTLQRHPKYKTELCRTYHSVGFCPYGSRCHFIHFSQEALAQIDKKNNSVFQAQMQPKINMKNELSSTDSSSSAFSLQQHESSESGDQASAQMLNETTDLMPKSQNGPDLNLKLITETTKIDKDSNIDAKMQYLNIINLADADDEAGM